MSWLAGEETGEPEVGVKTAVGWSSLDRALREFDGLLEAAKLTGDESRLAGEARNCWIAPVRSEHQLERFLRVPEPVMCLRHEEHGRPILRIELEHFLEEAHRLSELAACKEPGSVGKRLTVDQDLALQQGIRLLIEGVVTLDLLLGEFALQLRAAQRIRRSAAAARVPPSVDRRPPARQPPAGRPPAVGPRPATQAGGRQLQRLVSQPFAPRRPRPLRHDTDLWRAPVTSGTYSADSLAQAMSLGLREEPPRPARLDVDPEPRYGNDTAPRSGCRTRLQAGRAVDLSTDSL